ncbi:hypothetical protein [Pseudolysinimonas sp.]|uniref:hypothetical protein n=1 Tax=Pseudolysinimonas sp. TaxID=2680009 RepID=UPI003F7E1D51
MTRFPEQELFLRADAELFGVLDRLTPAQLAVPAPEDWTRRFDDPTLREIVLVHAHDEAFVPDVLAGRALDEIGDRWEGVLQDGDALLAYRTAQQAAHEAASAELDPDAIAHFSYGDYPLRDALTHLAMYRGFQSWQIARLAGFDHHMSPELVAGLDAYVMLHAEEWRQWGVFPPAQEPPAVADAEVRLLCAAGYWVP